MGSQIILVGSILVVLLLAVFFLMKVSKRQGRTEGRLETADAQNKIINDQSIVIDTLHEETIVHVKEVHEIHEKIVGEPNSTKAQD